MSPGRTLANCRRSARVHRRYGVQLKTLKEEEANSLDAMEKTLVRRCGGKLRYTIEANATDVWAGGSNRGSYVDIVIKMNNPGQVVEPGAEEDVDRLL